MVDKCTAQVAEVKDLRAKCKRYTALERMADPRKQAYVRHGGRAAAQEPHSFAAEGDAVASHTTLFIACGMQILGEMRRAV